MIENKLPRPMGFEVEFASSGVNPLKSLQQVLDESGIDCANANGWRRTEQGNLYWDLKTDSSCGYEAASPVVKTYEGLVRAAAVVDAVKKVGVINETCGLHVHVQANDLSQPAVDRLLRFLSRYQDAFFLLAPDHRRANRFCKPLTDAHHRAFKLANGLLSVVHKSFRDDKNMWVNGIPLGRIGTLEFRLMGGDVTPGFVTGWALLLQQVFKHTALGSKSVAWGRAKARDNRMLLFTMLQQAGCYGQALATASDFEKKMALEARAWAIAQFNKVSPPEKPVKPAETVAEPREAEVEYATVEAVDDSNDANF